MPAPGFDGGDDALLEPDRVAGRDKIAIYTLAFLQVALAQQLVDAVFDIGKSSGQGEA